MYHVAEIVRDAKRDMHERYEGFPTWAAYTPFPFLYSLGGQISKTMQRKAPDLVKRAAVRTRDQIADVLTTSQRNVVEFRLTTTRTGQRVFYRIKQQVETVPLPGALEPIRAHAAVPAFVALEGFAQFVTSEELPELYFVAKTSMGRNVFLRHLVLPPLGAAERVVQCVVIFPSQIVFPSREEIETRTDLFLDVSTSRVQAVVEYLYSATEVLDQHWSMVQWNILGRGPYESLLLERRAEVIKSIAQRMLIIESAYKQYEFMASIKVQNEMLYADVLREYPHFGGTPLTPDAIAENAALQHELGAHDASSYPCWFYKKLEPVSSSTELVCTGESASSPAHASSSTSKWIEFPAHENRRLERRYRWYQRAKTRPGGNASSIVLVDEGRHEVCMERMEMTPVYWPALEKHVVCRSLWLYAQRNYGLAPYSPSAARVLESAFTYYLAHYEAETQRNQALEEQHKSFFYSPSPTAGARRATLSVPLEGHLVEFKGPHDIMQYRRLLAGTTPFTSKRRVYRGDPRIKSDVKHLELWHRAVQSTDDDGRALADVDDDADIDAEIDHLVLIVHGIGDALKTIDIINVVTLRSIIDCATNLRELHREALRSAHFDHLSARDKPRVEFLPIEWHSKLHLDGLDAMIRDVTLPAIPKLREFANDTILDVLFFMSPMFHQVILREVAAEMNRVVALFEARNAGWGASEAATTRRRKKVSIVAHSLGAIICFDVLSHQSAYTPTATAAVPTTAMPTQASASRKRETESSSTDDDENDDGNDADADDDDDDDDDDRADRGDCESTKGFDAMLVQRIKQRSQSESECSSRTTADRLWCQDSSPHSARTPRRCTHAKRRSKPLQPRNGNSSSSAAAAVVPKLLFAVEDLFCFGSPVGLFLNVRGQTLARDYRLPTCRRLFNIYHPYDPVAYRIEPIVNPQRANSKAVIIRTFEGKLRFQYQLKNSFRAMWQTLRRWRRDFEYQVERSVRQIGLVESTGAAASSTGAGSPLTIDTDSGTNSSSDVAAAELELESSSSSVEHRRRASPQAVKEYDSATVDCDVFGRLCQGAPIDYTLQENEIEIANEYLFALTAHVIYWSNRDASLFVAQKMILEPAAHEFGSDDDESDWHATAVAEAAAMAAGTARNGREPELLGDDPETQTASLSSSSSSSSSASPTSTPSSSPGERTTVRRRSRRRTSEQQQHAATRTSEL